MTTEERNTSAPEDILAASGSGPFLAEIDRSSDVYQPKEAELTPEEDEATRQKLQKAERIQRGLRDCPEMAELVRAAFDEGMTAGEEVGLNRGYWQSSPGAESYWRDTEVRAALEAALGHDFDQPDNTKLTSSVR